MMKYKMISRIQILWQFLKTDWNISHILVGNKDFLQNLICSVKSDGGREWSSKIGQFLLKYYLEILQVSSRSLWATWLGCFSRGKVGIGQFYVNFMYLLHKMKWHLHIVGEADFLCPPLCLEYFFLTRTNKYPWN